MARVLHETSTILDAASRVLDRTGNIADVTMAAVIREARVPSGSVYHRFADRGALLGAMWNRAVDRFHADAYPLFAEDPTRAAALLTRYTVQWCARHPADAQALLLGRIQFAPDSWPAHEREACDAEQSRWDGHLRTLIRALRARTGQPTATLLLLIVDLPYAAVRRYLAAGDPVPGHLGQLVEHIVAESLAREPVQVEPAGPSGS